MRGLAIGIIALFPNLAAAQSTLVWKFKTGDVFFYETVAKSDEATSAKGQTLKQEVVSTWVYRFDVKAAGSDTATLQIQIEQVTVNNVAGATKNENKLLEKAKGALLTATVSPRGEIRALEGYDKLIDTMADQREALVKVLRQMNPEQAMRQQIQDVLAILPKEPVANGTRWQRDGVALALPPFGRFVVTLSGSHLGNDLAGHHRLAATLTGKYERPDAPADFFRVVDGNLTLDKGQWTCAFDNERGRVVNQKTSYELRGDLKVDNRGAVTPVEVLIRRELSTRLLPR